MGRQERHHGHRRANLRWHHSIRTDLVVLLDVPAADVTERLPASGWAGGEEA